MLKQAHGLLAQIQNYQIICWFSAILHQFLSTSTEWDWNSEVKKLKSCNVIAGTNHANHIVQTCIYTCMYLANQSAHQYLVVEHLLLHLINIHQLTLIHLNAKTITHMTTKWIQTEQHHSDLPRDETFKQYGTNTTQIVPCFGYVDCVRCVRACV